ncbi:hypothetical protein CWI80_03925 [Pseudidiomarina sediminum]|uniref:Uncharacterized protein n=1 Tax=Pseudidiomarina sediminum TaxID=431675 RepID=A0A432Z9B3_9GAMM|nr:hypothetical protein [Pseudidiomarina sediminum]RUO74498.1 hypothetical protein CWI80_03925 [Pseudidiomarina sediminum]
MKFNRLSCFLIGVFVWIPTGHANVKQFTLYGNVEDSVSWPTAEKIEVTVAYDTALFSGALPSRTDDAITEISVTFRDEENQLVAQQHYAPEGHELVLENYVYLHATREMSSLAMRYTSNSDIESITLLLTPVVQSDKIVFDWEHNYPLYRIRSPQHAPIRLYAFGEHSQGISFNATYLIHTLTYPKDTDADGIIDDVDQCTDSILSDVVELNGIKSSVVNYIDESGCSIMDHYQKCQSEVAQNSPFYSYRGPTYCQTQVGYHLYNERVITYPELRILRSLFSRF